MSVTFADVRWPAPNALFERMAQAMESHLQQSTINGQTVHRRCLGNVNDVFRQIGGSPRYLDPVADQAADVAEALRGRASRTIPPRGAICVWNRSTGDGDGHIAVADGQGNTVNNWGGTTVVRTALSKQTTGYVGWVSPALLGAPPASATRHNPAYSGPDTGSLGGLGGDTATETPKEPLPKPPTFKAGSGRSRPHLGDNSFTLNGKRFTADLEQAVASVSLDLTVEEVSQVTLSLLDPDGKLTGRDLRKATLGWDGAVWDISASSLQAAAGSIELAARSVLGRRMRRTYRVVGEHKVNADEWIVRWVTALGGVAVVQKTGKRAVLPEDTDQSVWDVLGAVCSDLGWSFVEYGGRVWAGSRMWAYDGGPDLPTWPVTWKTDAATDLLDASPALTHDDPDRLGSCDMVLRWEQGRRLRPWHLLDLSGLGIYDGRWLAEGVQIPNDGTSPVTVSCIRPRRKSEKTGGPISPAAPKDKKSPAYAKWFARRQLAKRGWNVDEQWPPLEKLWTRESGWRWDAKNTSSGAYGIPQALPADKMAAAGDDWRTNPETQIRWGLGYIKGRYHTPARAWAHFQQNNWY